METDQDKTHTEVYFKKIVANLSEDYRSNYNVYMAFIWGNDTIGMDSVVYLLKDKESVHMMMSRGKKTHMRCWSSAKNNVQTDNRQLYLYHSIEFSVTSQSDSLNTMLGYDRRENHIGYIYMTNSKNLHDYEFNYNFSL